MAEEFSGGEWRTKAIISVLFGHETGCLLELLGDYSCLGGQQKGWLGISGDLSALKTGQEQSFSAMHVESMDFSQSERILEGGRCRDRLGGKKVMEDDEETVTNVSSNLMNQPYSQNSC